LRVKGPNSSDGGLKALLLSLPTQLPQFTFPLKVKHRESPFIPSSKYVFARMRSTFKQASQQRPGRPGSSLIDLSLFDDPGGTFVALRAVGHIDGLVQAQPHPTRQTTARRFLMQVNMVPRRSPHVGIL
jgi:hypothetical protein